MTLQEYLKGRKCGPFKPGVERYVRGGDMVVRYNEDEPCISEQVDDRLVLHLSDGRVIGWTMWGVGTLPKGEVAGD